MAENLNFYNSLFNSDYGGSGGGGGTSTGGGSAVSVGALPNPSLLIDEEYLVEVKSNISDAKILFGSDDKGSTPNNFRFTLSQLRDKGGSDIIKLEKTNY
jgi:hypothetical protein